MLLCIALGGALGALMRYGATRFFIRYGLIFLPFGTLFVNLVGSFFVGLGASYFIFTEQSNSSLYSFIMIGLLGALTTFSTFAYDSFLLWQNGHKKRAYAFVFLNIFAGMGFVFIGVIWKFLV